MRLLIEPTVSLALTLESNPGVYACLLGSGVSVTSGIPTGWGIVVDLVKRVARSLGEDPGDDPAAWYEAHYGEEPNYSKLLDEVARTPTERARLLRAYFEPTEAERQEGLKEPTPAHRALASLAKRGVLRMFVTTNFDRLLEHALEDENITPTVVSSGHSLEGAAPLGAGDVTIVKVNGDYLDTRIKNTPDELSEYDPAMNALLDRIFAEYGLIVSGWSGQWDIALAEAFERCEGHCYSTYWAGPRAPKGDGARIMARRKGHFIQIPGADQFFTDLAARLQQAGTRKGAQAMPMAESAVSSNLPSQVGTFIGRAQTLDELDGLLDKSRLVTVHGVGGAGKTRTALELGLRRLSRHPDGVWFVELASVDADRVEAEVAAVLRVAPDRLESTPIDRDALLVVDNCEHVQEAAASIVERLLRSIPSLRVLATSRAPLGVHGEIVYELDPLGLPASDRATAEELEASEAAQLFVERARDVNRRFTLTRANANAVARIVRQLDGIPLALELAAARVRTIPADELADRLDDIFKVLRKGQRGALPQQTTLRGVGDWSWALLSEEERRLFERLSVFRDGFSLRAAEAVAADHELPEDEILDTLAGLIDKAVVAYQPGAEGRYKLLEPTRQYASMKLDERRDTRRFEDAHASYYLERIEEASPHLWKSDAATWMHGLIPDLENFRRAAEHLVAYGDPVQGVAMVTAGSALWFHRRMADQAQHWLRQVLERAEELPPELRAHAHLSAGLFERTDPALARRELESAESKFTELGLEADAAVAAACRLAAALGEGDAAAYKGVIERVSPFYEARPDTPLYGHLPTYRALVALHELDVDAALAGCQEGGRRGRRSGDVLGRLMSLTLGANIHLLVGDHATAEACAQEALSMAIYDNSQMAAAFLELALNKWIRGERKAARELAMRARDHYATIDSVDLAHITRTRHLWYGPCAEPSFADIERLVRLPPLAGAIGLMRGRFDELAMLDEALGREDLTAQFRAAAEELDAEFEAALQASSQGAS